MKKLIALLALTGLVVSTVAFAGEGQGCPKDKAACCAQKAACCSEKAGCSGDAAKSGCCAKTGQAKVTKGSCPAAGQAAETTAGNAKAKTKAVKSTDQAAAKK